MAKIYLTPQAQKDIKKIPRRDFEKIKKKLHLLEVDPISGKKLIGRLKQLLSLKAWPYRIIYYLDGKKNCWIVNILHHQEAYKK